MKTITISATEMKKLLQLLAEADRIISGQQKLLDEAAEIIMENEKK